MLKEVTTTTIAEALGWSKQAVMARAKGERWAYRKEGAGYQWDLTFLPKDVQVKLAPELLMEPSQTVKDPAIFKQASEKNRMKAMIRSAIISAYRSSDLRVEDFVQAFNRGHVSASMLQSNGPLTAPSFYRWLKAWKEDCMDGLVPKYGLSPRTGSSLSDLEKGYLEHWYLTPEKRSAQQCWKLLRHNLPVSGASYQATLRYLNALPKPLVDLHRLGRTKFDAMYQPFIDRDPTLYAPMEQVVSDHHCFDFVVIRNGNLFRPWITVFQDYRSAKFLGWWPSVYPSSLTIMGAFYRMAANHGLPGLIHIDNGMDYRSKVLSGTTRTVKVYNQEGIAEEAQVAIHGAFSFLGCDVTFSKPYHGQSKGRMERSFGSLAQYFSKNTGSYVGSNTVTRPEDAQLFYRALNKKAKRLDVYRWEDFIQGLEAFMVWWNANWRGEGKGLDGRTPDEVFAQHAGPKREVSIETLSLALTKPEVRKVRENGVKVAGVDYWSQELFAWSGREVIVRVPLGNPDYVTVMDPKGALICTATANYFVETGDLKRDNENVGAVRKTNIEMIDTYGVGKIAPPEGGENFIRIAEHSDVKKQEIPLFLPEPEILPLASGGDHAETRRPIASRYISPLDV